jgi:hypothetical protein
MRSAVLGKRAVRVAIVGVGALALGMPLVGFAPAGGHGKSPTCDSTWYPSISSISPNNALDHHFDDYAAHAGAGDWVGGDSNYIVRLPDGRLVALYSDTFTGPVNPDGSIAASGNFIHNSMLVYDGVETRTIRGGTAAEPSSIVEPEDEDSWYWQNAAQVHDDELQVINLEFHQTGTTGIFDFEFVRNMLVRYDADDLTLIDVTELPSSVPNLEWNAWLHREGGYTYIYGVRDGSSYGQPKYLRIARVSGTDLRGLWQFFTGSGWSSHEEDGADLLPGVGNNFSVSKIGGVYVLVTQDTTEIFSRNVVMYFSCSLTGPFVGKTLAGTTPETGPFGSYGNADVIFYNVHEQTVFRNGNTLVFSYDLNSLDPQDVHDDVAIYRPRYYTVTFSVP